MGFYWLSWLANQKARKAIDNVASFWIKLDFSPHLFPAFDHFGVLGVWGLGILLLQKRNWRQFSTYMSSYWWLVIAKVLPALSKFNPLNPAALDSTTTLTMLWRNLTVRGQTHKTDVNLLNQWAILMVCFWAVLHYLSLIACTVVIYAIKYRVSDL